MARGKRKHLKRVAAPKSWMLSKLGGVFAPKPRSGPHKWRESLPLVLVLRNKLKYALTYEEVNKILRRRLIKIDGKTRRDAKFPAGFMDVVNIEKTNEHLRVLLDAKSRYIVHRITQEEARYKLCRVNKLWTGSQKIPHLQTHDNRTIRFPDPLIKLHDTVQVDIATGKITDFIKFELGNLCMVTNGGNAGRVGVVTRRDRHPGSFDIVHIKDGHGNMFATRLDYVFIIGRGNKPHVSLPHGKGIRLTISEERDKKLAIKAALAAK